MHESVFLQFKFSCKGGFFRFGIPPNFTHFDPGEAGSGSKYRWWASSIMKTSVLVYFSRQKLSPCRKPNGFFQWKLRYGLVWGVFSVAVLELLEDSLWVKNTCLGGYTTLSDVGLAYGTQKHKKTHLGWMRIRETVDSIRIPVLVPHGETSVSVAFGISEHEIMRHGNQQSQISWND